MKKRSIGKMLLLTIVTIGIYRLYWFIKTRAEMKSIANVDIPTPWIFAIPFFGYVFGIGLLVVSTDSYRGSNPVALLVFYGILFASFLIIALWLWRYSKAVEIVTNEKLSFALSLIVLLAVPDGIDILIIQDYFNKLADAKTAVPVQAAVVS